MTNLIKYKLYFPEDPSIEGTAEKIIIEAQDNHFIILPKHAPLVATIKLGSLKVQANNEIKEFKFNDGFVNIKKDLVVLDIIK